VEADGKMNG